jgi:hypothetical protein
MRRVTLALLACLLVGAHRAQAQWSRPPDLDSTSWVEAIDALQGSVEAGCLPKELVIGTANGLTTIRREYPELAEVHSQLGGDGFYLEVDSTRIGELLAPGARGRERPPQTGIGEIDSVNSELGATRVYIGRHSRGASLSMTYACLANMPSLARRYRGIPGVTIGLRGLVSDMGGPTMMRARQDGQAIVVTIWPRRSLMVTQDTSPALAKRYDFRYWPNSDKLELAPNLEPAKP